MDIDLQIEVIHDRGQQLAMLPGRTNPRLDAGLSATHSRITGAILMARVSFKNE